MVAATKLAGCRLQQLSDETLMELVARCDDHDAFAELFRRYERKVFWCVLRRLGHWQWAEDVTAEVFATVFTMRSRYRPGVGLFRQWLFHNARYAVLQCQNRRRRDGVAEIAVEPSVAPRDAEEDSREEERAYQLRTSIERLPPKMSDAVMAVCIEGQTSHQFGKSVGRTQSAVDSSLYYGLRRLHADKALAALV